MRSACDVRFTQHQVLSAVLSAPGLVLRQLGCCQRRRAARQRCKKVSVIHLLRSCQILPQCRHSCLPAEQQQLSIRGLCDQVTAALQLLTTHNTAEPSTLLWPDLHAEVITCICRNETPSKHYSHLDFLTHLHSPANSAPVYP